MPTSTDEIGPVAPADWEISLAVLLAHEQSEQLVAEVHRIAGLFRDGKADPNGLLEARRKNSLLGVVRGDMLPGGVGFVWGPRLMPGQTDKVAIKLLQCLDNF